MNELSLVDTRHIRHIANLWDANAPAWIDAVRHGRDKYRANFHDLILYPLLGSVDGLDVLDAGCGEGVGARELARRGARVVGIDISPVMIAAAMDAEKARPLGIEFFVESFETASCLRSSRFDKIVSVMALMNSPDLDASLRSFARLLRPEGELVISVSHPFNDRPLNNWLYDYSDRPTGMLATEYFRTEPWEEEWEFNGQDYPPFRILTFPFTVAHYIRSAVNAGLSLKGIYEETPSEQACDVYPRLRRWKIIPFYLFMHCCKSHVEIGPGTE